MLIDRSLVEAFVANPSESLHNEIKSWIDPNTPEGKAKIIKASLAIRNYGGGYLLIGFENDTLEPLPYEFKENVRTVFHLDKIQGMIAKYSSEIFEVAVEFVPRDNQEHPVRVIESGVKTPVAAKITLLGEDQNKPLICEGDIYVRSLRANNTPSTTKAKWNDWPKILDIFFENREADIGRFLRRHVAGISPDKIRDIMTSLCLAVEIPKNNRQRLEEFLEKCHERFLNVNKKLEINISEQGSWEVGLIIDGEFPQLSANKEFLNLLRSHNPRHTGWPIWVISSNFSDVSARPYVYEDAWEAFIVLDKSDSMFGDWSNHIDFMRLDPVGKFYLFRSFEDDTRVGNAARKPMQVLDFRIPVLRTAEAMSVGISFARAMGCIPESTKLEFAFKWNKLANRELICWTKPSAYSGVGSKSHQDDVLSFATVPLEISPMALSDYVLKVIQPLFRIFDGYEISANDVGELTREIVEKRY